jgi:UDP-glucuronate decarboxylase
MGAILITGGTGFFGRSLLRYLLANNRDPLLHVVVLSRDPEGFLSNYPEFSSVPWLDFYKGDISSDLKGIDFEASFTHIIHAAADSTLGPKLSATQRYDQIVEGTKNVLEFAVATNVQRVLYISSGGAYGPQPPELEKIPESFLGIPDPLAIDSVYGISKRMAEHLCCMYRDAYGLDFVVARCFAFVGPDLPAGVHFAIGNFIRDVLDKPEIVVNGDGSPLRSYLYQEDLAEWLLVLLSKGVSGEAYNVGSDQYLSVLELATLVRNLISPEKEVKVMGMKSQESASRSRYVPDIKKAKTELGLEVGVSLSDAIKLTAAAYKRDGMSDA